MLEFWLRRLGAWGVREALVNTHHLHEQVEKFAGSWKGPPRLRLCYEPTLLGSAGTLRANRAFVEGEESFLVLYADNLTAFRATLLSERLVAERARAPLAAIALFRSPRPRECGIASLDAGGWVTRFIEKPNDPGSNLANAGIYAFTRGIFDRIPEKPVADIGRDLIPRLVPRILGVEMNEPFLDIGTMEAWRKVEKGLSMEMESPPERKATQVDRRPFGTT